MICQRDDVPHSLTYFYFNPARFASGVLAETVTGMLDSLYRYPHSA